MDKEDVVCVYTHTQGNISHKTEWNNAICSNMDENRECHTKQNKSD